MEGLTATPHTVCLTSLPNAPASECNGVPLRCPLGCSCGNPAQRTAAASLPVDSLQRLGVSQEHLGEFAPQRDATPE